MELNTKKDKYNFRIKVLKWLSINGIDIGKEGLLIQGKKYRIFNTRRYGLEMRIYNEPMEVTNMRKSFRERKEERDDQRHGSYGIHTRKISTYTHINEDDFKSEDEKEFILNILKATLNELE